MPRFRWIYCQLETLSRCFPPSIRRALDELPVTLDETYERALKEIDKEKRDYANRLFHCLVVSIRPLHVEELAELFAILPKADSTPEFNIGWRPQDPEEFILSTCTTLVSIVKIDGERVIQFSHFSVREYLTSARIADAAHVSHFHILPKSAHTLLARACLSVLFQLDFSIDETKIRNFPLAPYAARHWIDHARYEDVASDIQDEMYCLFDRTKPYFSVWIWLHDVEDSLIQYERPPHPTQPDEVPLYYAALCGFHDLSERLLDAHPGDVDARGGYYETPLQGALYRGYLSIVLLLLERGADPECRDHNGQTALYMASSHGYSEVVRSLIDHGANLNTQREDNDNTQHVSWTPLQVAIHKGHLDIALLLLERGADPDSRYHGDQTALYMASSRGYSEVVGSLIDRGADLDSPCQDNNNTQHVRWTPLQVSINNGHLDIALLLLEHGADPEPRYHGEQTAIYMASSRGYTEIVQSLLGYGADLDVQCEDKDGWDDVQRTPLQVATHKGHHDIVSVLMEHVHMIQKQIALYVASSCGNTHAVGSLLDQGIDPNTKCEDNDGRRDVKWTPLQVATRKGHLDTVLLLLVCGADLELRDHSDQTALYMASSHGYSEVVHSLIDHGADLNAGGNDRDEHGEEVGWTPLHAAIYNDHPDTALLLVQRGANTETRSSQNQTPLYMASSRGFTEVVRLLIDHGVDVDAQCDDRRGFNHVRWTPLLVAIYKDYSDTVLLLLERGANAETRSDQDQTPLSMERSRGFSEAVRLSIDHGADVDAKCDDQRGFNHVEWSPLQAAMYNDHPDTTPFLLECGANTETPSSQDQTPPYMSPSRGFAEAVRLSIDHGAGADEKCDDRRGFNHVGWIQPQAAMYNDHPDTTLFLLERGADTETRSSRDQTILYMASSRGFADVVRLLIDHGADVDVECDDLDEDSKKLWWTPLHAAIYNDHPDIARLLLERGVNTEARSSQDQTALYMASSRGFAEVVRLLIDRGADVDAKCGDRRGFNHVRWTPLCVAIYKDHPDIALLLLERGANMETRSSQAQTPLYIASSRGFAEVVRLLINHGADVDVECDDLDEDSEKVRWTPLHAAIYKDHPDIALLLLERGANTKTRSSHQTPLYMASSRGFTEVVRLLIDRGADVDAKCGDRRGFNHVRWTPLCVAIYEDHPDIALLLLERGANMETRSNQDQTPLYMASSRGFAEVARLLIDRGANVDEECDDLDESVHVRWTPLHVASNHGSLEIARMLLEHGADMHYRDNWGWSPLHHASWLGFDDVSQLLLDHGANPNAANASGKTALHVASSNGQSPVVKLLLEYGANVDS